MVDGPAVCWWSDSCAYDAAIIFNMHSCLAACLNVVNYCKPSPLLPCVLAIIQQANGQARNLVPVDLAVLGIPAVW